MPGYIGVPDRDSMYNVFTENVEHKMKRYLALEGLDRKRCFSISYPPSSKRRLGAWRVEMLKLL
jgi:hypothetical protein